MHVDHEPFTLGQPLDLHELLLLNHIGALRTQHHRNASMGRAVPILGKAHRFINRLLAHCRI